MAHNQANLRDDMGLSNIEYVAFAAYLLSAFERPVDTEDIAIKAHEIAPDRFCWKKYSGQINLAAVSKRLFDARLPKNGSLVEGSDKIGWTLTQQGVSWAKRLRVDFDSIASTSKKKTIRSSGIAGAIQSSERKRIVSTKAYSLFCAGRLGEISKRDAEHVFRFDDYVVPRMRALKITRANEAFSTDVHIIDFLKLIEKIINGKESAEK